MTGTEASDSPRDRTGLDHVCFRAPDRGALKARERRLGDWGAHSPVSEQFGALFLIFRDPDNFQLELGTD